MKLWRKDGYVLLAVQSALADLRAISSDLELPDIDPLGLDESAARVVRDFQTPEVAGAQSRGSSIAG